MAIFSLGQVRAIISRRLRMIALRSLALPDAGLFWMYAGDLDNAIEELNEAVHRNPDLPRTYINRAALHNQRRDFGLALADTKKALRLCLDNFFLHENLPTIHFVRGIAFRGAGELDNALAEFDLALRAAPHFGAAHYGRSLTYLSGMKLTHAAQEFDHAARLVPREPEFRKLLGYARYLMGDFSGATAEFRSLTKAKGSAAALLLHYLAAARAGEAAESEIRSRLASHRGEGWTRCVLDFYLENRSPDDLLAAASKKLERGEAHYFIGCRQLMDKRGEEAVQSFRAAIDLCPKDVLEHIGARVELNRLNPEIPIGRDSLLAKGSDFAR